MLSVETAKKAAKDAFGNKLDVFTFRTADIIPIAEALIKAGKIDPAAFTPSDYYYEMVVRRSNERIKKLADDKGFQLLLKLLRGAVAQLAADRQAVGKVLSHRKVADFFGLDLEQASFMLKETAFELMFYPEWVNKVLGAI